MNVPRLRFSEFSEAWEKCKLKDLYDIKTGLNKEKEYFGYGIKILNYMDVNKRVCNEENNIFGLVEVNTIEKDRFSVRNNDLFFTRTSETSNEIGLTSVYKGNNIDLVFSGFILRARPKKKVESLFYAYYLRNRKMRKEIIKHSSITTRALTSGTLLYELLLSSPQVEEQQKIGDFFMLLDKRIEQQEQKIALLKDYKKAMMQRIFSQKIRFKDQNGNDYPDWEEKKLGEICRVKSSQLTNNVVEEIGKYPVYGANSIVGYTENYEVDEYVSIVKDGAGVGRIAFINNKSSVLGTLQYLIGIEITTEFLYVLLNNVNFKLYQTGTTIPHIYFKDYSKMIIDIPCQLEQEKISSFLFAMDLNLENQEAILNNLKEQKQGLLRKMFV